MVRELHDADLVLFEQSFDETFGSLAYETHLAEDAARCVQQQNYVGWHTLSIKTGDLLPDAIIVNEKTLLTQTRDRSPIRPAHGDRQRDLFRTHTQNIIRGTPLPFFL
jgi:hypothetical protein